MRILVSTHNLPVVPEIGRLVVPRQKTNIAETANAGIPWACDNDGFGGFGAKELQRFRWMIDEVVDLPGCMWVAVPDVVGDHQATLASFWEHLSELRGMPAAFVLQNGARPEEIPWNCIEAVFIGGDDEFKLGPMAHRCALEAKARGKLVHMGRVNSLRRMRYAVTMADSIDGTKFARWSDTHLQSGINWLKIARDQLFIEVAPCASEASSPGSAYSTSDSPTPATSTPSSSNGTLTGEGSSPSDGQASRSSTTSVRSEQTAFPELTVSSVASPARVPRPSGPGLVSLTQRLLCGPSSLDFLANCDLATPSSRTWPTSSLSMTEPSGEPFSGTWPRSGLMRRGTVYPLLPSAPRTSVIGSSALLGTPNSRDWKGQGFPNQLTTDLMALMPTPRTSDSNGAGQHGDGGLDLRTAVALLPTPRASKKELGTYGRTPSQNAGTHGRYLGAEIFHLLPTPTKTPYGNNQSPSAGAAVRPSLDGVSTAMPSADGSKSQGLRLNPEFVEWMLGAPQGWSDPASALSAMESKSRSAG